MPEAKKPAKGTAIRVDVTADDAGKTNDRRVDYLSRAEQDEFLGIMTGIAAIRLKELPERLRKLVTVRPADGPLGIKGLEVGCGPEIMAALPKEDATLLERVLDNIEADAQRIFSTAGSGESTSPDG